MKFKSSVAGVAIALGLLSVGAGAGTLSVPSGLAQPSPLFGAKPFKARVVLFEEFGPQDYKVESDGSSYPKLPSPIDPVTSKADCAGNPTSSGEGLDELIRAKSVFPAVTEYSQQNDPDKPGDPKVAQNNWWAQINACQPETVGWNMPLDGRPWGEGFKHQRWNETRTINGQAFNEFQPKKFFQAIMAGARVSGGARDKLQSHGYQLGEFGPGPDGVGGTADDGLYYNTVTSPYAPGGPALPNDAQSTVEGTYQSKFQGTTKGIPVNINPLNGNFPDQNRNAVWTFDGTIPPKLLMARYGETLLFRHHNALPITDSLDSNRGFGTHTITTHEHNGHNPAESDGFAGAFFYPGQHYDYRWPMVLAGHDSINISATDKRAATPCGATEPSVSGFPCEDAGDGSRFARIPGDYRETMSTHWFHDHMLDFTAQNVYKGNAAMMNYYSAVDRGNEVLNCKDDTHPDNVNLCFPSGSAKEWGNRDYDVNLVIGDKAFDQTGQLFFNPLITDGYLGDVMTVNWVYKPYMDVRARRYRFRILNGSVSRYVKYAWAYQDAAGRIVQLPTHMIANDGNLLQHSILFPNAQAGEGYPTQAIAERDDIIVDFSKVPAGAKVYLVNLMEHSSGTGPKSTPVTLAAAFSAFDKMVKGSYQGQDLAVGKFMEFRIRPLPAGQTDKSMDPAKYVEGKSVLQPLPTFTADELKNARHRTFVFGRGGLDTTLPWTIATDGGADLNAEIDRISAAPVSIQDPADRSKGGSVEIWHLSNPSGGWSHPAHIHFEEGRIIARNGVTPPAWERLGRKDMYRLGPEVNSSAQVDVAIRVRDMVGTYVEHCHNTQHEDHAMLLRWDAESADHANWVRTPYPTWAGANYDGEGLTNKLPTADTGSKTTSLAKNFKMPAGWGGPSADVPASSAPNP
jgi:FtsP/CotA-like multicopper oxidase with cupredoxin domain